MDIGAYTTGQKIVLGGAAVAAIAAFLPWFSIELLGTSASVNGIDRDGVFSFIFALLVVGFVLYAGPRSRGRKTTAAVLILGLLIALIGGAYIYDPWIGVEQTVTDEQRSLIDIGIGLYLTLVGGALVVIGTLYDTQ